MCALGAKNVLFCAKQSAQDIVVLKTEMTKPRVIQKELLGCQFHRKIYIHFSPGFSLVLVHFQKVGTLQHQGPYRQVYTGVYWQKAIFQYLPPNDPFNFC